MSLFWDIWLLCFLSASLKTTQQRYMINNERIEFVQWGKMFLLYSDLNVDPSDGNNKSLKLFVPLKLIPPGDQRTDVQVNTQDSGRRSQSGQEGVDDRRDAEEDQEGRGPRDGGGAL